MKQQHMQSHSTAQSHRLLERIFASGLNLVLDSAEIEPGDHRQPELAILSPVILVCCNLRLKCRLTAICNGVCRQ